MVTESFGEGFTVDSVRTGGTLRPDIIKDLKLATSNEVTRSTDLRLFLYNPMEIISHLMLSPSNKSLKRMRRAGLNLSALWIRLRIFWMSHTPPSCRVCRRTISFREGYGLLELGLELRLAGRKDMINFIRALPMTAQELVEEYFESEIVKAAIASVAIHGSTLGPMSAGTGYTLIHNWMNRGGLANVNVGKAGEITNALANAVKSFGGEIQNGCRSKKYKN